MRHSYRPAIPPKPQPYRTQVLDHLGLVAGMFEELGITEVIDRATKQDPAMRIVTAQAMRSKPWCSTVWALSTNSSTSVRDHRVATRGRRRSWRSVSLSPSIFLWTQSHSSAINVHQSDPVVCRLETSWNRCLRLTTPSGRFPLRRRTGSIPRGRPSLCAHPARRADAAPRACGSVGGSAHSRTPRPHPGHRHRIRHTRSLASARPPPRPAKQAGNRAIQAIARRSCPLRPSTS